MPLRVAHLSDIHYAPETLKEVDRCFTFAVDAAIDEKCEAGILSGDLFDHKVDLHTPAVNAVLTQVRRLADAMPVLILQGTYSHDAPGSLDVFKHVGGRFPVHVADRIEQVSLYRDEKQHLHWRASENWLFERILADTLLLVSCLPSINKGEVAAKLESVGDAATAVGDAVFELMQGWAPNNLQARSAGIPTIVTSHGTVSGCVTEHGCPMSGLDHEFSTGSLFAAEASAVMLGHIHAHQEWEQDGRRIAYPGSVGRLHFGEMQDKGLLIWDVAADRADAEFIVTPAKALLQADFDGAPDMAELATLSKTAEGAHVRVRYQIDEEFRSTVDKRAIEKLFMDAGAEVCKVEGRINPIQRSRASGMNKAVTLADKVKKWGEVTETEAGPLVERLAILESKDTDQIVADVVGDA
ncbi:MAG TPA: metallophosphatase family protein [Gammaproteobacteria bacterium]|nr:metallophosphatase family protein [Gammaproteobacteria bacterium]